MIIPCEVINPCVRVLSGRKPVNNNAYDDGDMRESNMSTPNTEGGYPSNTSDAHSMRHLLNTVHRDDETSLLYRVIDIYDDRQLRLAKCRRALMLPDGNLSTVSIDEVDVIDISKYERLSNKDRKGVKDDKTVLSNESLNILKGHSDLNDDFLTHFCLLVGECVAEVNLPKNHKQAMLSADAEKWRKAEEEELRSMKVNNVLKPSKLKEGVVPLTTKGVYTVKTDGSGNIVKYKARLLAL